MLAELLANAELAQLLKGFADDVHFDGAFGTIFELGVRRKRRGKRKDSASRSHFV